MPLGNSPAQVALTIPHLDLILSENDERMNWGNIA